MLCVYLGVTPDGYRGGRHSERPRESVHEAGPLAAVGLHPGAFALRTTLATHHRPRGTDRSLGSCNG